MKRGVSRIQGELTAILGRVKEGEAALRRQTSEDEELIMPNPMGDKVKMLEFLPSVLTNTFRSMEIAEQEINKAKGRWPRKKDALHKSFRLLMPGPLSGVREEVYRHHCQEILERVVKDEDTTLATKAEMMVAISEFTLKIPINSTMAALYERLFLEVIPRAKLEGEPTREPYKGAAEEMLQQMRKRGRVPHRGTEAEVFTAPDVAHEARAIVQGEAPRKVRPVKARKRPPRIVWDG